MFITWGSNSIKQAALSAVPGNRSASGCVTFALGELHWLQHFPNFITVFFLHGEESQQQVLPFLWDSQSFAEHQDGTAAEHLGLQLSQSHTKILSYCKDQCEVRWVQLCSNLPRAAPALLGAQGATTHLCVWQCTRRGQTDRKEWGWIRRLELQIIFYFLLILRIILLCLVHNSSWETALRHQPRPQSSSN